MKIFISYHRADSKYKDRLIQELEKNNIDYYSVPENYDFDGKKHQEIASIILENMKSCDVTICLVGNDTYKRPHVDHEIKATLKGQLKKRRGLLALLLPTRRDPVNQIDVNTIPLRVHKNYNNELFNYALIESFHNIEKNLVSYVIEANNRRADNTYQVRNNKLSLMPLRKGSYYDQPIKPK